MATDLKSPTHYGGNWDVGDFIRDQALGFHLGNAIKYICRAGKKGSKEQDLQKAIHYLENELKHTQVAQSAISQRPRVSGEVPFTEWFESEFTPSSALLNL